MTAGPLFLAAVVGVFVLVLATTCFERVLGLGHVFGRLGEGLGDDVAGALGCALADGA